MNVLKMLDSNERKKNKELEERREGLARKRAEIQRASEGLSESIGRFAELSAEYHRGELVRRHDNHKYLYSCSEIVRVLHSALAISNELESKYIPEEKVRQPFFPIKKSDEVEVIDVCPE